MTDDPVQKISKKQESSIATLSKNKKKRLKSYLKINFYFNLNIIKI
jgi:hypothetical protein